MSTIAEKLQIIIDGKAAIKQAIIDKGGEVGDFTTYASAIANLPSGGGDVNPTAEKNDVTFYDYDGTIRYSYTAKEFLALTEMPPLPTQKGLICQEWNWSFEDAMEYVAECGVLDVGATYITDDGHTRLYIEISTDKSLTVPLYFYQSATHGVAINWGDGSVAESLSGIGNKNTSHVYKGRGIYCIDLHVQSGSMSLGNATSNYGVLGSTGNNGRVYCNMLQKVELGSGHNNIRAYAFYLHASLKYITIPKNIVNIDSNAFNRCFGLKCAIIPNSSCTLGDAVFTYGQTLSNVVLPAKLSSLGSNIFQFCQTLQSLVIPSDYSIPTGFLSKCYALLSVKIPSNVNSIKGDAFYDCWGLQYVDFSNHKIVPSLGSSNVFTNTPSSCKIIVPDDLYSSWTTTTNWTSFKTKIIKSSQVTL